MNLSKKELKTALLLIGVLFLLLGCSKAAGQKNMDGNKITATVIEDSKENCRLSNESDCSPIEIKRGETEKKETNNTQEAANTGKNTNKTINISEEVLLSNCEDGWKCVEAKHRAYQFSNCSWISIDYCVYGCNNGTCSPAPICKPNSLKCDKDNLMVCNADGSEWKFNESCDYQCDNSVCIGKNDTKLNNSINSTNATISNSTNASNDNSTPSSTQICDNNCISITDFHYNGGNDSNCQYLNNEYVTFKNNCLFACNMSSWTINDASNNNFIFPVFTLYNGVSFALHTGNGNNTQTDVYWNRCRAVWNNNGGDTLYLRNSNNELILSQSYS